MCCIWNEDGKYYEECYGEEVLCDEYWLQQWVMKYEVGVFGDVLQWVCCVLCYGLWSCYICQQCCSCGG